MASRSETFPGPNDPEKLGHCHWSSNLQVRVPLCTCKPNMKVLCWLRVGLRHGKASTRAFGGQLAGHTNILSTVQTGVLCSQLHQQTTKKCRTPQPVFFKFVITQGTPLISEWFSKGTICLIGTPCQFQSKPQKHSKIIEQKWHFKRDIMVAILNQKYS
jgi:hypothetical protein